MSSALQEGSGEAEVPEAVNLIDQYVALLMATFIECGLLDVGLHSRHSVSQILTCIGSGVLDWRECQRPEPQGNAATGRDPPESQPDSASSVCCPSTGAFRSLITLAKLPS